MPMIGGAVLPGVGLVIEGTGPDKPLNVLLPATDPATELAILSWPGELL